MKALANQTSRVFYGWWIVLAGIATMSLSAGLFFLGFGFYFEPMRQQFNWSRTLLSGASSLSNLESGLAAPVVGFLIQRFGSRNVMSVGFVVFSIGFFLLSRVNSPLSFYLAFFVLAVGSGSSGFAGVMASLNNWFRRKRARAMGFAMLGLGLGGVVAPRFLVFTIDRFGWQDTAFLSGVLVIIIGVPISRVVRNSPEAYGQLPDGIMPPQVQVADLAHSTVALRQTSARMLQTDGEFTISETIATRAFWLISVGHALALFVISTVILHQVPYLETDLGFSRETAAIVLMTLTGMSMVGQVSGGFLGDRFPKPYLAAGTLLGHSGALLLLATANSFGQVMLSAAIQGLAWGVRVPVLVSIRGDYFGRKSFPMVMGISQSITMVGMMGGPLLSGYLADQFNYSVGFMVMAALAFPGSILFLFLRKPIVKKSVTSTKVRARRSP